MDAFNYEGFVFYTSVDQLLADYPEFVFNAKVRGTTDIWHDLEKKATPHGVKNLLKYDIELVLPLIRSELERLLEYRNALIKILAVIPAEKNKKLVMNVLENIFGIELNLGGGSKPAVQRVVKMYETEGKITKKRKSGVEEGDDVEEPASSTGSSSPSANSVAVSESGTTVDSQSSSSSSSSSSSLLTRADSSDHIAQKAKWELNEWWDVFEKEEQQIMQETESSKVEDIAVESGLKGLAVNPMADVIPEGDFDLFSDDDFREDGVGTELPVPVSAQ